MKRRKVSDIEVERNRKEIREFTEKFMYNWIKNYPNKLENRKVIKLFNSIEEQLKKEGKDMKWFYYVLSPFYYLGKLSIKMGKNNILGQEKEGVSNG